ncbi:hypothetical protein C8R46DRAFT_1186907 [Mycena filopes]|nr:hypothetical protein C8R46DRAFT_1186907 [Mycena filopes]
MAELKDTHSVNTTEEKARREGVKPMFLAKVNVLNQAIVECGLGRYQARERAQATSRPRPQGRQRTIAWLQRRREESTATVDERVYSRIYLAICRID